LYFRRHLDIVAKKNKLMPGKKLLMMAILGERKRSQYLPAAKAELGEVVAS